METHQSHQVAIIGMSGIFPEAPTLAQFYQNLREGRNSVRPVSKSRLSDARLDPEKRYHTSAFLDHIDFFDHDFFHLSRKEAELMDPGHRLLLELVCQAIENAGYPLADFAGSQTAVYLGGNPHSFYYELIGEENPLTFTGNLHAMAAGRIAYLLNLCGPALMIDTACSSSLVAVHEACVKLIHEEVEYALVGGVNTITAFNEAISASNPLGILSPDGTSKTFDREANGTGVGEGGGILLLKRLDKALRDRDVIQAVIRGSAINQDGSRSNGMTAPSPQAQTVVIRQAWKNARIEPENVSCLEAHGTGTKLGDPIELKGIMDAFGAFTSRKQFCALSSVKTNIGHLNNAAGVAGMIKSVLSLKHRQLFPSLHFDFPSPFIDFENTAVYINTGLHVWETEHPARTCGVSSFGLSGTNAHVVLEEFMPPDPPVSASEETDLLLKVSAKSASALQNYLTNITAFLEKSDQPTTDIVYTLNKGRDDYPYRRAVAGRNREELIAQLKTLGQRERSRSLLATEKGKAVVLLFSNCVYEPECIHQLSARSGIFSAAIAEIKQVLGARPMSAEVRTFAIQYALYKQWEAYGIAIKLIIGTGIGRITKQVITRTLSISQALTAIGQQDLQRPLQEEKLRSVYDELTSPESLVFLELGASGILYEKLMAWRGNNAVVAKALSDQADGSAMEILAELYSQGLGIDWNVFYANQSGVYNRIEVPTYPFDKIRCWAFEPKPAVPAALKGLFHQLTWQLAPLPSGQPLAAGQIVLVWMDENGWGEAVTAHFNKLGLTCIGVYQGNAFIELSPNAYQLDQTREAHFENLVHSLMDRSISLAGIIHLGGSQPGTSEIESQLEAGLYPQFYLAKAFDPLFVRQDMLWLTVTRNARQVVEREEVLHPVDATSQGFALSLKEEYPLLKVKCVDVDEASAQELGALLAAEITAAEDKYTVAYRKGIRYLPQVEPAPLPEGKRVSELVEAGGVYVITGGSSGIGLEVSQLIGEAAPVRLVIIGRTPLPVSTRWGNVTVNPGDSHREAIQTFQRLEKLGTEVHYYAADLADGEKLTRILKGVQATIGPIRGVIHSAGVPGKKRLKSHSLESFQEGLSPKVQGTVQLYHALETKPDFFILFSSLNALMGAEKNTNYSAANLFEDNFVHQLRQAGIRAVSVNWPGWAETGMLHRVLEGEPPATSSSLLSTPEGLLAFDWLLALDQPHIICTKEDLRDFADNPYFTLGAAYQQQQKAKPEPLRKAAPAGTPLPTAPAWQHRPDWTEVENALAGMWYAILKKPNLALDDNFFEIGGHSINGAQVINRIEAAFHVNIEFESVFGYPTLKELAKKVSELIGSGEQSLYADIEPVEEKEYYDVSFSQKQLWILEQLQEEQFAYNIRTAYELEGDLNRPAFDAAFAALIQRHESLRTTFLVVGGVPKQKIHPYQPDYVRIGFEDLSRELSKYEISRRRAEEEARTVFDLHQGPLVKGKLIQLSADRHVFLCTMHHIISDGKSMDILVKEFMVLYHAFCQGEANPLPPLRIQYKDYTGWQRQQLSGARLQPLRQYWLKQFQGDIPVLELPTDFPRPAIRTFNGSTLTFVISPSLTTRIRQICQQEDVTLFMLMLTAVKMLLYRYSGQTDVVVGTPLAGRGHRDLEDQIGFYVNTLALRSQFEHSMSFRELLKHVKERALGAYAHQDYSFIQLVEDLKLTAHPSRASLFDVMVQMPAADEGEAESLPGLLVKDFRANQQSSKFDMTFEFKETGNGQMISVDLEYSSDLFLETTIENVKNDLLELFQLLETDLSQSLLDLKKQLSLHNNQEEMNYFSYLLDEGVSNEY